MENKILVISTYPPKGSTHNHPFSAVASYTKNTLLSSQKADFNLKFLVLADKLAGQEKSYEEDGIQVIRSWERNNPKIFLILLKEIFKNKDYKKVFFAFEWAMFGQKKWLLGIVPLFLLILKIFGEKVYFISHGILLDADRVSEQMGVKKGSFKAKFWTIGLRFLYYCVVLLSYKIVAFEEYLRQELVDLTKKGEKIVTIPHGVEEARQKISYESAREKLKINKDEFILMCFGFLTWYKGSDWLVQTMTDFFKKNPESKLKLMMVGGATKTYENDPVYQKFIKGIYETAETVKDKIVITGFLPEEEIGLYYSAADLIILPYRAFVSSSGPLSWAFSYQKPVILSEPLALYLKTEDVKESLTGCKLTMNDLTFQLNEESLLETVEKYTLKEKREELKKFSELMFSKRNWQNIGKMYSNLLSS